MTEQRLEPGAAATLAHNTLSAQISALINITTGAAQAQANGLQMLLDSNMAMVVEASNEQVDELNSLIDLIEQRDNELSQVKQEAVRLAIELKNMRAGRADDESKVKSIFNQYEQVKNQRDNYKREADEVGKVRAEMKRLKNQSDRHAEAQAKKDAELVAANQTIQRLRARLAPIADAVRGCTDLMRFTRQTLIFEGLAPEQTIEYNGEAFHIYRRPGDIAKEFQQIHTDRQVSREHQFYFRVETNSGYHCDIVPLDGGDIAAAKHKAIPAKVKQHLIGLFKAETMFDHDKIVMRSDALTERLDSIDQTLIPLESLLKGMEHQLITNQVVSNSTVNRNKNKRRAA